MPTITTSLRRVYFKIETRPGVYIQVLFQKIEIWREWVNWVLKKTKQKNIGNLKTSIIMNSPLTLAIIFELHGIKSKLGPSHFLFFYLIPCPTKATLFAVDTTQPRVGLYHAKRLQFWDGYQTKYNCDLWFKIKSHNMLFY